MESITSVITCPNCGANTSNHLNCEYCGSLLVRFADLKIDISNSAYFNNEIVFPGLIENLTKNINSQTGGFFPVGTDILIDDDTMATGLDCLCVIETGALLWQDNSRVFSFGKKGLAILISFAFQGDDDLLDDKERDRIRRQNERQQQRAREFRKLQSFPLFKCKMSNDSSLINTRYSEYAIDFGYDIEGAARLISEILIKVYNFKSDDVPQIFTGSKKELLENRKVIMQSAGSSGGCYIATAVYGTYDCPEVWTLRRFRDYTLDATWYGRLFIKTYYAFSPTVVKWFGNTEWFRRMWKSKLDRMVKELQNKGVQSTPYKDNY